jgi:hypothetical protein
MKNMTNGTVVAFAILELGGCLGIGYLYDWRAGVTAFIGAMLVSIRIAGASNK